MKITASQFFKLSEMDPDRVPDCVLTGAELQTVFWKYQELQQGFERQQVFWKTANSAIGDAYKKLATVQEALQASQEQLREANERLEEKVRERTAALDESRERAEREFREQLERIRRQQETIRTLFSPIIQLWPRVLALPIVGELDQERATETTERLLGAVAESRSCFVIIDITGVKALGSVATSQLLKMHRATRLLGADCLISGTSPSVAQAMAQSDDDLKDLASFRTLEAALRHAFVRLDAMNNRSGRRP
jgi:rsbT co-antagonist protein RsbR